MSGPLVIKVGGTTVEDAKTAPMLWSAIAELSKRDGGVVVVHGGGKAVDRLLDKLGFTVVRTNGLRVTPPEQIEHITGVLAGSVNKGIVAALTRHGVRAVGLCLGDGQAVATERKPGDLGLVGEVIVAGPEPTLLPLLLRNGFVPVLSSIGIDREGTLLNVNADDAAAGVAYQLRAQTLVLMTDVPGILDGRKELVAQIDSEGIEAMIADGSISGGMIVKARAAAAAAQRMGGPVVVLSGNDPAALAGWAGGKPVETRILPHQ